MHSTRSSTPSRFWRVVLVLAAVDSAAVGAWAVARPDDLFALLSYPATGDRLLLCRVVGFLLLSHFPCLLLAAWRTAYAGLTLFPLAGRLLLSGVWLWLLGSGRMSESGGALIALLVHEVVWPPLLAAFLATRRVRGGASRGPELPASSPAPPA